MGSLLLFPRGSHPPECRERVREHVRDAEQERFAKLEEKQIKGVLRQQIREKDKNKVEEELLESPEAEETNDRSSLSARFGISIEEQLAQSLRDAELGDDDVVRLEELRVTVPKHLVLAFDHSNSHLLLSCQSGPRGGQT